MLLFISNLWWKVASAPVIKTYVHEATTKHNNPDESLTWKHDPTLQNDHFLHIVIKNVHSDSWN